MSELNKKEKNEKIKEHLFKTIIEESKKSKLPTNNYVSWDVGDNYTLLQEQLNKENNFDY